ncbi:MAG: Peptidoglycan-N-acetylglucosamine deacetylase [Bacteroidota bacterium]
MIISVIRGLFLIQNSRFMSFYWIKTNFIVKKVFSNYIWDVPNNEKKIYLTFDDGPTPEITDWTLTQLEQFDAKATFFCIGDNIKKHPEIFQTLLSKGHAVGNHTFNHLNGWKTEIHKYLENTKNCEIEIGKFTNTFSKLFRPPYGRIKSAQAKELRKLGYKIIMWDILSADFDATIAPEECLQNVVKNIKPGSIIVFHDSQKAFLNLEYALPKTLAFLKEKGFSFAILE